MDKTSSILLYLFFSINILYPQFGSVKIDFDDRLLRSDEKHDLINLKEDIRRFYLNTDWDRDFSDLQISLNIQLVFEGVASRGNVKTYLCKALFSNGGELRYFDKGVQFYYSPGSSLYFDLVLFEPLSGFLAYYAQLILGGEIDTYDFRAGSSAYEVAREIGLRGSSSDYQKGWSTRIALVDDITKNIGLRSARLSYYIALDLIKEGNISEAINEFNNMLDGLEQSYVDFGREQSTQYFMKVHSENLSKIFYKISNKKLLIDLKHLDPDNSKIYQSYLDKIDE